MSEPVSRLPVRVRLAPAATLLVGIALLAWGAPSAGAQPGPGADASEVTFYGHVFGHTADLPMPANVEYPFGETNYGLGSAHECTPHGEVLPLEPDVNPDRDCTNSYENSLVLYSTAGFVDVSSRSGFVNGGGYSQFHNERGQAKPVLLDADGTVSATIHLTLDFHSWYAAPGDTDCAHPHPEDSPCAWPNWAWDAGAQPDFQVRATLYSAQLGEYKGEAASEPPVEETLREGDPQVVAQGETEPQLVADGLPGTPKALEFQVDMGSPQVDRIPRTHDFFVVYQFYSNSSGERWSPHTWRIWSGEFFPPEFEVPVENAFAVESVIPRFVHGKLAVLGVMGSPWGSYDIDPDATELTVRNKDTGEIVRPHAIEVFSDYSVAHGGHFDPANVTYVWDYQEDGLEPGEYEVTVEAANHQGSVTAACSGNFTIRPNGQPGPTDVGSCGFQSLTEEQREELERNATEQAGDGQRLSQPDPLPGVAASAAAGLVLLAAAPRP